MASTTIVPSAVTLLRGGEWLLTGSYPASIFTPERTTEEHRLIAQTVADFVSNEVLPVLDRLEEMVDAICKHIHCEAEPGVEGGGEQHGGDDGGDETEPMMLMIRETRIRDRRSCGAAGTSGCSASTWPRRTAAWSWTR